MLHLVLYVLLAIVVAVGLFLVASRFLPAGEQIAPVIRDEPVWALPAERSLRPEDVDGVRLPVALRGYRFAETDVLLDRLAGELRVRDAEIARLRSERRATGDPSHELGPHPTGHPVEDRAHEPDDAAPHTVAPTASEPPEPTEPLEPTVGSERADDARYAPPAVDAARRADPDPDAG